MRQALLRCLFLFALLGILRTPLRLKRLQITHVRYEKDELASDCGKT